MFCLLKLIILMLTDDCILIMTHFISCPKMGLTGMTYMHVWIIKINYTCSFVHIIVYNITIIFMFASFKGGWWYGNRYCTNPNGLPDVGNQTSHDVGIVWFKWKGWNYSLKTIQFMFKPALLI